VISELGRRRGAGWLPLLAKRDADRAPGGKGSCFCLSLCRRWRHLRGADREAYRQPGLAPGLEAATYVRRAGEAQLLESMRRPGSTGSPRRTEKRRDRPAPGPCRWRCWLPGSSRHARTFRAMTSAPGTFPSRAICESPRMSISAAPERIAARACAGGSLRRSFRASASSSSIVVRATLTVLPEAGATYLARRYGARETRTSRQWEITTASPKMKQNSPATRRKIVPKPRVSLSAASVK
jgi:hypothetical protein